MLFVTRVLTGARLRDLNKVRERWRVVLRSRKLDEGRGLRSADEEG
jgi:hypothetical protein